MPTIDEKRVALKRARLGQLRQAAPMDAPNVDVDNEDIWTKGDRAIDSVKAGVGGLFQGDPIGVPFGLGELASKAGTATGAAIATPFSDKSFGKMRNAIYSLLCNGRKKRERLISKRIR